MTFPGKTRIEELKANHLFQGQFMKSVLVVTTFTDAIENIRQCLKDQYTIECADSKSKALRLLHEKRHSLFFIDTDILLAGHNNNNYRDVFGVDSYT